MLNKPLVNADWAILCPSSAALSQATRQTALSPFFFFLLLEANRNKQLYY